MGAPLIEKDTQSLTDLPESELASLLGMSQYAHTQPLGPEASLESSWSQSLDADGKSAPLAGKRRRGRAGESDDAGFSFEELLERVQCSEVELRRALVEVRALRIVDSGKYCAVPEAQAREIATAVLRSIAACGIRVDAIPVATVIADLEAEGHASALALHALMQTLGGVAAEDCAAEPRSDGTSPLVPPLLRLDFRAVARFIGIGVLEAAGAVLQLSAPLASASRAIPLDSFFRAWASAMPVGTVLSVGAASTAASNGSGAVCTGLLDIGLLAGEVLLQDGVGGPGVLFLPASSLSSVPAQRFRQLFSLRAKWRLADLEPFVQPLANPASSLADLLLAHTRSSQQPDGSRLFSARA